MSEASGLLLVDKPEGPTSFDVVAFVRRATRVKRCGHTGTLDPFASGLLPICVGAATRLSRFIARSRKTYEAVVRFGWATDTYDATGRVTSEPKTVTLDLRTLEPALESFLGAQRQVPPPYSAKRVGGQRLYRLAREGKPVRAEPVEVFFESVRLDRIEDARAFIELKVSSGTYIRGFAHDLGVRLGSGAHLECLRRTRVGPFTLSAAIPLDAVPGSWRDALLAPVDALPELPRIELDTEGARRARHGQRHEAASGLLPDQHCRLVGPGGALVAVGRADEDGIRPVVVLA